MHIHDFIWFIGLGFLFWLLASSITIYHIIEINRTVTTNINNLPNKGLVKVVGSTGNMVSKTPICNLPCVAWQLEVQECIRRTRISRDKGIITEPSWKTVYKHTYIDPFVIYDDTGNIFVKASSAELILKTEIYIYDPDIKTINILNQFMNTNNSKGSKRELVVYERFVPPSKQIYVLGKMHRFVGTNSPVRNQINAQVISDLDEEKLLLKYHKRIKDLAFLIPLIMIPGIILYIIDSLSEASH